MKSERGITFLNLTIVIGIVIVVVMGITAIAKRKVKNVGLVDLKTDMLLIQGKIKLLNDNVIIKKEGAELVGTNMSENPDNEETKEILENNIVSVEDANYNGYYILSQEDLEKLELAEEINLTEENKIVVNYATGEVIYTKGYKDKEGKIYYRLSEIMDLN